MAKPKRLYVMLSLVLYAVFGVPVWWKTTEIRRPPLPHDDMQRHALLVPQSRLSLPVHLHLYILAASQSAAASVDSSTLEKLHRSVLEAISPVEQQVRLFLDLTVETTEGCSTIRPASSLQDGSTAAAAPCLSLSATTGSWQHQQPEQLDELLRQQLVEQPGHCYLFVLPAQRPAEAQVVVGQHRHGWLLYDDSASSKMQVQLLSDGVVQALASSFAAKSGATTHSKPQQMPLSASASAVLSFSLCNADLAGGVLSWDFGAFEARYLQPLTAKLQPAMNLSVQSQVLYHTPARLKGSWSNVQQAYVLRHTQLPFWMDSEWNLEGGTPATQGSSSSSTSAAAGNDSSLLIAPHLLHWVVYVPPPQQRPLLILQEDGQPSPTNSMWIPSWGGVIIINPPSSGSGSGSAAGPPGSAGVASGPADAADAAAGDESSSREAVQQQQQQQQQQAERSPQVRRLDEQTLATVAGVMVSHLHGLLGLPTGLPFAGIPQHSSSPAPAVLHLPARSSGFAAWQVDALVRQRAVSDLALAAKTLGSLSNIVQKLPNLEMPDLLGQQVQQAMAALAQAQAALQAGDYPAASHSAAQARSNAEAAFLHPAVLAQLNFPDSHKLGIYMPLFLPVSVPILQGLLLEVVRLVRKRRSSALLAKKAQ